jgi:hypothetical protein
MAHLFRVLIYVKSYDFELKSRIPVGTSWLSKILQLSKKTGWILHIHVPSKELVQLFRLYLTQSLS